MLHSLYETKIEYYIKHLAKFQLGLSDVPKNVITRKCIPVDIDNKHKQQKKNTKISEKGKLLNRHK